MKNKNSDIKDQIRTDQAAVCVIHATGQIVPRQWLDRQAEAANAISHGAMSALVVFLLAVQAGKGPVHASYFIFLGCLVVLFATSALYHALPPDSLWKNRLNRLDHMVIYWAIAGTYTPVAMLIIGGAAGHLLLILQWLMVAAGMLFKTFAFRKGRLVEVLSVVIYALMGWMIVFFLPFLSLRMPTLFWIGILAGGLSYTIGIIFFSRTARYSHFFWHLFVMGGAGCHLLALLIF